MLQLKPPRPLFKPSPSRIDGRQIGLKKSGDWVLTNIEFCDMIADVVEMQPAGLDKKKFLCYNVCYAALLRQRAKIECLFD
jgi:hypothetical protein